MTDVQQCFHCREALPDRQPDAYSGEIAGERRLFCCPACRTVAETIHSLGLAQYYEQRDRKPEHAAKQAGDWSDMDIAVAEGHLATQLPGGELEMQLHAADIHCASCCWLIEHRLMALPGVSLSEAQLTQQKLRVRWRPATLKASEIFAALDAIGYPAQPWHNSTQQQEAQQQQKALLKRTGLAGIVAMQIHMIAMGNYFGGDHDPASVYRQLMNACALLLSLPVWFYSAQPFFSSAWHNLRAGFLGMDLPVAIAIVAAAIASIIGVAENSNDVYFDSIAMFVFLLLGARYLEARARSRMATDAQTATLPLTCTRLCNGQAERISINTLNRDDIVLVDAGETIAADGVVIAGDATVEQAAITGEFLPVSRKAGDRVLAGSRVSSGSLQLSVSHWGNSSHIAQLQAQVDRALTHKSRTSHLLERSARLFTPMVLLTAAATAVFWLWLDPHKALPATLAVLVASCPCALSLAIPAALTATTITLRKQGILITGSHVLGLLPRLRHLVFDKTGSLTEGRFRLLQTEIFGKLSAAECLAIAGELEKTATHPVASAFPPVIGTPAAENLVQTVHKGISGDIAGRHYRIGDPDWCGITSRQRDMQIGLSDEQGPLALFTVGDTLRPDASRCIADLQRSGIHCSILSGDHSQHVDDIAATLGIREYHKGCSPADKVQRLDALKKQHGIVAMLGDGINDGPVLAHADISLSLAGASQTARLAADVLLLNNRLGDINRLREAARRTQQVARQNVAWALLYNIAILPLAAAGYLPPALAALGMALSSLLVTLNALRLFRLPAESSAH